MQRPPYPQWRRVATPIALAVLSLFSAIGLWVAVTDAENPTRVDVFRGAVEVRPVNVPEGLAVANIRDPSVSLRVSAAEDDFKKLTAADFRAEVDLSGVRQPTSDQLVLVRVVGNKDVEVVEVSPAFVTVVMEPALSKLVPVQAQLVGSPPQGYSVAAVEANPATVRVTGAASLVQLVASASADVNLTGLRVSLQQQTSLTARDSRGADIRGVSLEPGNADIRVGVAQQEVTLALTVVPVVQGSVAEGFNLVGLTSDPPAIAVSGPLEALQSLSFLNTEAIDVSGLKAETTRQVRLRLPVGLQATRDTVTVRLKVAAATGELTLSISPQVNGLGENLKSSLQAAAITVRLGGDLPLLRGLQPGAVRAVISVSGLEEGYHVLKPVIVVPEGVKLLSFDPAEVVVVIRR